MTNKTRQVQKPLSLQRVLQKDVLDQLIREYAPALLPPFGSQIGSKRRYPGKDEADYLLSYLSRFPQKREGFLKSIRALQRFEEGLLIGDFSELVRRFTKEGVMEA